MSVAFCFNCPNDLSRPGFLKAGGEVVAHLPSFYRVQQPSALAAATDDRAAAVASQIAAPAAKAYLDGRDRLATVPEDVTVVEHGAIPTSLLADLYRRGHPRRSTPYATRPSSSGGTEIRTGSTERSRPQRTVGSTRRSSPERRPTPTVSPPRTLSTCCRSHRPIGGTLLSGAARERHGGVFRLRPARVLRDRDSALAARGSRVPLRRIVPAGSRDFSDEACRLRYR